MRSKLATVCQQQCYFYFYNTLTYNKFRLGLFANLKGGEETIQLISKQKKEKKVL
jgi:hypothetical protein